MFVGILRVLQHAEWFKKVKRLPLSSKVGRLEVANYYIPGTVYHKFLTQYQQCGKVANDGVY